MRKILVVLAAVLSLASCGRKKDLGQQIEQAEKQMGVDHPSPAQLDRLANLYTRYADSLPKDQKSPVYLVKASDIYHSRGNFVKTCQLYKKVIDEYPHFKDLDMVMYLYAFSLDSELDDRTAAKQQYESYLQKFPKSQYVADAKTRLSTIDSLSFKQLQDKIIQNARPGEK